MIHNDNLYDKNLPLIALRKRMDLSAKDLAKKLGYAPSYISYVENGKSEGKLAFWQDIQTFYGIPDADMWNLMNGKFD